MLEGLKQPEYVHVLLNPLPVYATAMGVIALLVGLLMRSRQAQGVGLIIVLIGCGSIWPVMEYGDRGMDRVKSMSDADGAKWIDAHEARADQAAWVFYATAGLAVAALVALWKFPKISPWLVIVAVLGAMASVGAGAWISEAGGRVRHKEFRHGPPPVVEHD